MLKIDFYAYQSRWRKVNPSVKAILFIVLLISALCTTPAIQSLILVICCIATCYATRISFRQYLRWLSIPLFFLLFGILGILISFATDDPLLWSVHIGNLYIGTSLESISIAQHAFFRSLSCLAVTYLFVLTTPFDQLIWLGKQCKLPDALLENILLTYRFIFIFIDEVIAIKHAQTLRFGYTSIKNSYHSFGMLIGLLLERVLLRYKQMLIALDAKLFTGKFHL